METKVCKCCGKELPITEFGCGKAHGKEFVFSICKTCMSTKQSEEHKRRKEKQAISHESEIVQAKTMRLKDFTPRELMQELKRRGYEFEMTYTEVRKISSKTL